MQFYKIRKFIELKNYTNFIKSKILYKIHHKCWKNTSNFGLSSAENCPKCVLMPENFDQKHMVPKISKKRFVYDFSIVLIRIPHMVPLFKKKLSSVH